MNDIPTWLNVLAGMLTPLLGIIATAIIIMQYFLQRDRWKLDLFDKRYPIYESTKKYIAKIVQEGKVIYIDLDEFLRQTKDSEFLFGNDVNAYLKLLYKKGVDYDFIGKRALNVSVEKERLEAIEQEHQLLDWFSNQFKEASEIFGKYLTIDKK